MIVPDRSADRVPERARALSLLDLGLRGPTLGVIQRQGILSVGQLTQMTPDELVGMRRVGLTRMLEIRQALQLHGLDLRTDEPAPPVRAWEMSRRVRLTCCETGDCALELRTSGMSAGEVSALADHFVDAHRACPRLSGREPVVTTVAASRPALAALPMRPSASDEQRAAEDSRTA